MRNPLISIITVAYNEEENIERTLKSVEAQTLKDFEYIIIDGASTDGTVALAQKYCPPVTKITSEQDKGIAQAMNKGINLSCGEIIVLLNAGDEFADADVLKKTADSYGKLKWPWAIGSANIIAPETGKIVQVVKVMGFDYEVLQWMNTSPHQSLFMNRKIFEEYGLFDETFKIAMDYEFLLRIGRLVKPHILPFCVSNMWAGGVSSQFLKTYFECCRARNKNNPEYKCYAFILDLWQLLRYQVGQLAQRYLPERLYQQLLRYKYRVFPGYRRQMDLKNSVVSRKRPEETGEK